jgi:hypothetical protein
MVRPFLAVMMLFAWVAVAFAGAPGPADQVAPKRPETGTAAGSRINGIVLKPLERKGLLRSTAGLRVIRLANGSTMADIQGRYREFVVASVDAQGQLHVGCVHNERELLLVLEGRAQAARTRYEER